MQKWKKSNWTLNQLVENKTDDWNVDGKIPTVAVSRESDFEQ